MNLRMLLIVCCLLFPAPSIFAQSLGAFSDPIPDRLRGSIRLSAKRGLPLAVEPQFEGKMAASGIVTGPLRPAKGTTGMFTQNRGAMKLEVDAKGNVPESLFVFGSAVFQRNPIGRVAGHFQNGADKSGHFGGELMSAQQPGDSELAVALRKSFGEVSGWVTKAADLVPADKYSYRPTQSVRTFGQLIGHIADSYNFYCARAAGQNTQWSDPIEKGVSDKATLIKKLQQSLETCNQAYGSSGQAAPLIDNVAHTNLHYGNIVTYIRMLGLKPPSS